MQLSSQKHEHTHEVPATTPYRIIPATYQYQQRYFSEELMLETSVLFHRTTLLLLRTQQHAAKTHTDRYICRKHTAWHRGQQADPNQPRTCTSTHPPAYSAVVHATRSFKRTLFRDPAVPAPYELPISGSIGELPPPSILPTPRFGAP